MNSDFNWLSSNTIMFLGACFLHFRRGHISQSASSEKFVQPIGDYPGSQLNVLVVGPANFCSLVSGPKISLSSPLLKCESTQHI